MTAPTPNVELLRAGLARVEAHPEEWDQAQFRCKTGGCFAFHALVADAESGHSLEWLHPNDPFDDRLVAVPEDDPDDVHFGAGAINLRVRAQRVLGLTFDQSLDLFHPCNSLDDLRRIVGELTEDGAR